MSTIVDRIADAARLKDRQVWCLHCGRTERVTNGLATGWPKCCGYTMTIDPPEVSAEHLARKAASRRLAGWELIDFVTPSELEAIAARIAELEARECELEAELKKLRRTYVDLETD